MSTYIRQGSVQLVFVCVYNFITEYKLELDLLSNTMSTSLCSYLPRLKLTFTKPQRSTEKTHSDTLITSLASNKIQN